MAQRTILTTLFLVMMLGASSAKALLIGTKPAWNGWVRAGMPTEVAIRVVGDHAGLLTLTLSNGAISYTQKTNLKPGVESVWRVSLSSLSRSVLQFRAQLDEEPGIEQEIVFRRHLALSPLVAVLADQPLPLDDIEATTIYLAGDSLPFHSSSFATMDLILIDLDSLKGVTRQQLIALRQHAAQCGRIVIIGSAAVEVAGFAQFAGCGGRFLMASETPADIGARVADLLEARVPPLPSPSSLRGMLAQNGMASQVRPLALFFTIYLCVLLITMQSQRAPLYFVCASFTATLVGLIAWAMSPEHSDQVVWTEMGTGASVARFTSIQRVLGGGDRTTINIPVNTGAVRALQPMNLVFMSAQNDDDATNVSFDTLLFSQHEFVASGATSMQAPLMLNYTGELPRVTNTGTIDSPPAVLAWNDHKYTIPALTTGQDWQPSSGSEPWGANRAERLFRQRAMLETTALFFEFPSSDRQAAGITRSYLMVRP